MVMGLSYIRHFVQLPASVANLIKHQPVSRGWNYIFSANYICYVDISRPRSLKYLIFLVKTIKF